MDELKITQQAGVITTNLDAIEAELKERMAEYKDYLVTEDSVKSDKKILADLRKLEKELNDARIATKKKWDEPYAKFEERCKAVIALVSEPISLINEQIKLFDEEKKAKKRERCKEIYAECIGEYEKFLPYEKIARKQWDNATYSESDVKYDISEAVTRVKSELNIINNLGSEIYDTLIQTYIDSGNDLAKAIERNTQYVNDKNAIEQAKKVEEPEKVEPSKPIKQLDDLAQMVRTVKVIFTMEDWTQAKEMLDFAGIKYSVERE